jgi:hypothetical protein
METMLAQVKLLMVQSYNLMSINETLLNKLFELGRNSDIKGMGALINEVKRMLPREALGFDDAGKAVNSMGKGTYGKTYNDTYESMKLFKKA